MLQLFRSLARHRRINIINYGFRIRIIDLGVFILVNMAYARLRNLKCHENIHFF
jgi:hypothetical protein